jgi:hypothetical protein
LGIVSEIDGPAAAGSDPTAFLIACSPEVRGLVERLRRLVCSSLDNPEERVYTGWRGFGYHDEQAGYVCGIFPRRTTVRLLFEHGAALTDPDGVFTGGGSRTRYIELEPGDQLPETAIRAMIGRAVLLGVLGPR